MLIKHLEDRMEQELGNRLLRGIRHVWVGTPDGQLHRITGVEGTFGGDLVIVAEPEEDVNSN